MNELFTPDERDVVERVLSSHPLDDDETTKMFIREALPDRFKLVDIAKNTDQVEYIREHNANIPLASIEMNFMTKTKQVVYQLYILVHERTIENDN